MTASASLAKRPRRSGRRAASPSAAPSRRGVAATPEDPGPRYLQIARELTAAIASGRYPVGARLPTELELCEHFAISRFTAREAVRVLSTAGLVTRRQRVGTVVIATPDEARYTHAASSVSDLFQYAQDTELRLIYIGKLALARDRAQQFGVGRRGRSHVAVVRHPGRPQHGGSAFASSRRPCRCSPRSA